MLSIKACFTLLSNTPFDIDSIASAIRVANLGPVGVGAGEGVVVVVVVGDGAVVVVGDGAAVGAGEGAGAGAGAGATLIALPAFTSLYALVAFSTVMPPDLTKILMI
jgi:hypothetical protein